MWAAVVYLQNLLPFSRFKFNDLRASDDIVRKLPIPESTKNFVYAIREPETDSVIYILLVQNLSENSASDADCLIRVIKPDAVVLQLGNSSSIEVSGFSESETGHPIIGKNYMNAVDKNDVPTSVFEVLKKCFMLKINKEEYENVAGNLILREIFGVCFDEHVFVAKKAAQEVGSSCLMLESPFLKSKAFDDDDTNEEAEIPKLGTGLSSILMPMQVNNLVSRVGTSALFRRFRAFDIKDSFQHQMVKSLSSYLASVNPVSKSTGTNTIPLVDYEAPQYAKYVYPLLCDLHDMFVDIPSMGTALACAQKMLCHVNRGESIDNQTLSEIYAFQIAVEGLRIALTNAGRLVKNQDSVKYEFSDLPFEDKSQAIFTQAIRSQAKKYKSVVAVVDAVAFSGLRKHWKTVVPSEIQEMVDELVIGELNDAQNSLHLNNKRLLSEKPVVAVGAGASAILGASYLSKLAPFSTYIKLATVHIPSSLQILSIQTHKALVFALSKVVGPTNVTVKYATSAGKIRAVAHSMIASAEKTSLSAMRTSFYEIMRKRRSVRAMRLLPWVTFCGSIATCTGLLVYGDGIECAAESVPAAPSIANLGRGIRSLHEVSQVVRAAESWRIQKSIEKMLYKFKKIQ